MKRQRGHEEAAESNRDKEEEEDDGYEDGDEGDFDLALDESNRIADVGRGLDFNSRSCSNLVRSRMQKEGNFCGDGDAGKHDIIAQLYAEARALDALDREVDLDSSFWLPAALLPVISAEVSSSNDGAEKSDSESDTVNSLCLLEKAALEIFRLHTDKCTDFDPERSGAEWWVQVRHPNHQNATESTISDQDAGDSEMEGESIQWHFDKDETLQAQFQVHCAPQLSTVTYLTNVGAPTVVLPFMCNSDGEVCWTEDSGEASTSTEPAALRPAKASKGTAATEAAAASPEPTPSKAETRTKAAGFLSLPRRGKHLVFDGRLLHAAPVELRCLNSTNGSSSGEHTNVGSSSKKHNISGSSSSSQNGSATNGSNSSSSSGDKSGISTIHESVRVTLLVNVWLHHQPFGIEVLDREAAAAVAAAGVESTDTFAMVDSATIATATTRATTAAAAAAEADAPSTEPPPPVAASTHLLQSGFEVVWDAGTPVPMADGSSPALMQVHTFPVGTSLGQLKLTCPFPTVLPPLNDVNLASEGDRPEEVPSSSNSGSFHLLFDEGNMPQLQLK